MRFPVGVIVGSASFRLAAIDEGFQNVLLYVEVVVVDRRKGIAEKWQIFHRFVDAVVVDIVARRLGA